MADRATIARPYARAAFAGANADGKLSALSEALHVAAAVVQDPRVEPLLGNPHVPVSDIAELIIDVAGTRLDEEGRNLVRTVAENNRLGFLPEIAAHFDELKDAAEGIVDVTVTSATQLDEAQQSAIAAALERRLKRQVRLHLSTDPTLIGGAVLRAGDLVIDGSLRARLERIAYDLTA